MMYTNYVKLHKI